VLGWVDVRVGSKADIGSLNRSPRRRRLADYSREDAKSCNAIPAKRFTAPSDQRRVQSVGLEKDFYGTAFGHAASYIGRLKRSQIFPLRGMICIKKIVIQKSQNRPYATPNLE
jgi:hypothetical protein